MKRIIYLFACLFIFSVAAFVVEELDMATVAPGERSKICEQGCLSECCRVEAVLCLVSNDTEYSPYEEENVSTFE